MRRWHVVLAGFLMVALMAGCGSLESAVDEAALRVVPAKSADQVVGPDDPAFDPDMATEEYWIDYGSTEFGETWTCWAIADAPSEADFLLDYTPTGYTWRLGVVTKGDTHHLFFDPVEGDVFETGGYDQVIACKRQDVETPEAWCSPGYWRQPHHLHAWAATGIAPDDLFFDELGYYPPRSPNGVRSGAPTNPTLWQVLQRPQWYGGAAFNAVGDLLSAAHPDVNFLGNRVEGSCPLN